MLVRNNVEIDNYNIAYLLLFTVLKGTLPNKMFLCIKDLFSHCIDCFVPGVN